MVVMASITRTAAYREADRRRRIGGPAATFVLFVATVFVIAMVGLRLLGIDGDQYLVIALAGTPYVAGGGIVLVLLAALLRRWAFAVVALAFTACLIAAVAPRAFSAARPFGVGPAVRVMSLDLGQGHATAASVVSLVRDQHVDVLSLQELTPESAAALNAAGLNSLLPNQIFQPGTGPTGSGLASSYPLRQTQIAGAATFGEVSGVVSLSQNRSVEVLSVHVLPPTDGASTDTWKRELAGLPDTGGNVPRVLAGDFNATVDHAGLRSHLTAGYVDAASQTGAGLVPTWPANTRWPELLPTDHVLVDNRCPVDTFSTFTVPGTDHQAVLTQFVATLSS